ncbi:conserved hypothetical protein [Culex quinquefasciatus]|uniref:SANT domain-containing protein n=1 Tax=Culex quinquefasciatus TaxID=7176 RepID=B0W640_CULQU|nr:conserved hypothetical protein [Culex quinquefasciatus]|eukprot:XP_001844174.1 conserved hypothetical protein [Culex quinquefasciatus]
MEIAYQARILGPDKSGPLHACFVCKTELCPRTRPLERGRGAQYGIPEEAIPPGARVCNTCQCKSVKSRYTHCPLPTCPNPKDRVKRFRNLPPRLFELAPEIRDPIVQELQIPPNVSKCCTACLTRIRRKMGPHLFGTNLTDDEVARMKKLLQDVGPKWNQLAEALNKTPVALKSFYFHYKKKCGFDAAVTEYYKQHPGEDRRPAMTDGDESDLSASSSDERDGSSDTTASAESPNNSVPLNVTKDEINTVPEALAPPPLTKSFDDDLRLLPPGQPPRKQKLTEEYDSSATETADEENETSPANRQSPKVHYPPMNPVISVHHPLQNGPRLGEVGSPQNVRDAIQHVIERSLKSNNMMSGSVKPPTMKPMNDSPFVRDYRDLSKGPPPPTSIQRSEGMATLSVVNSHAPHGQLISHHPHSIGSQIQATITPVPHQQQQQQSGPPPTSQPQPMQQQQQPPPSSQSVSSSEKDVPVVFLRDPEPQTLDLSIKKPQRDNFPPPAHNSKPPSLASTQGTLTLYTHGSRTEFPPPSQQQQQNIPTHGTPYGLSFHGDSMGRPSKSPSGYITTLSGGPTLTLNQGGGPPNQPPNSVIGGRGGPMQQQQHTISLTPPPMKKSNAPKLSPKMQPQHQQQQVQSGMQQPPPQSAHGGGPKGSITHGTPVNAAGQQIIIQGQTTLSPRYDNMLRQTPPSSNDKHGSITQGTPVHLSHALPDKRSAYEYKSAYNNRQSPAQVSQPPPQGSPQAPPPQFAYSRTGPTFSLEPPPPQFSSQQIIMNDYITSQQMQGRNAGSAGGSSGGGGRPEKESPSPRSVPTSSPASLLFSVPDRSDRSSRPEYLSRASPADHVNRVSPVFSTPSPHRTPPPPQRQGVIQRHNTGSGASGGIGSSNSGAGSKPPSPAPNRLHLVPPPSHHYMSGHDAFTSLVDLAVQQQPMTMDLQRRQAQLHPSIQQQHQSAALAYREQQMERDRELNYRIERDRQQAEAENEDRRRRQQQRERIAHQEEEDRRRKHYDMINERMERPMETIGIRSSSDGSLTAANLIDAIITHQINQTASEPPFPPSRDMQRPPFFPTRDHRPSPISENNGKSHSPNVINIDVDSEPSVPRTKNITIGELAESIIAKDYSPNPMPFLQLRQSMMAGPPGSGPPGGLDPATMGAPDAWKYRRMAPGGAPLSRGPRDFALDCYVKNRIVEAMRTEDDKRGDDGRDHQQQQQQQQSSRNPSPAQQQQQHGPPPPAHHNKDHDRSSTPGDMMIDEETGRPASGGNHHRQPPSSQQQQSLPPHSQSSQGGVVHNSLHSSPYMGGQPVPVTTFPPQTYYPYSALTVSGGPVTVGSLGPPPGHGPKVSSMGGVQNMGGGGPGGGGGMNDDRQQSSSSSVAMEPKPLLSAQYEALSDED